MVSDKSQPPHRWDRYEVFCGIDVARETHHAMALNSSGRRLADRSLAHDEAQLRELFAELALQGRLLVVIDQPASIGALAIAVARACGVAIAYLPGLAMRRIADLYPGEGRTVPALPLGLPLFGRIASARRPPVPTGEVAPSRMPTVWTHKHVGAVAEPQPLASHRRARSSCSPNRAERKAGIGIVRTEPYFGSKPSRRPGWDPIVVGLTPHDLRHSHKTWMIEDGIPEVAQAERLGHTVGGVRGTATYRKRCAPSLWLLCKRGGSGRSARSNER